MRALAVSGGGAVRAAELEPPRPGAGEVAVEVHACGVCGSDLRFLEAATMADGTVLGHEAAGVVVAAGEGVDPGLLGARVTINPFAPCGACAECDAGLGHLCARALQTYMGGGATPGAFAELVAVQAATALPLPDSLALREAALAKPTAVAVHALRLPQLDLAGPVAVLGGGPIGLLVALVAGRLGAGPVVVVSRNEARAARARALGLATASADEVAAGRGLAAAGTLPAVVIECAGTPPALDLALALARPGGDVVAVGVTQGSVRIVHAPLVLKEIRVRGSLAYTAADFELAIELLASGALPADELITQTVGFDDAPATIAELGRGGSDQIKVVLEPRR